MDIITGLFLIPISWLLFFIARMHHDERIAREFYSSIMVNPTVRDLGLRPAFPDIHGRIRAVTHRVFHWKIP